MKKHLLLFTLLLFIGLNQVGWGQVSLTSTGTPFTQNFDVLANTGTSNTWADNTTIVGWYTNKTVYIGDNGSSSTGGLHSYGTTSTSERAVGALTSGGAPTVYIGVRLVNNTSGNITSFDVAYKGEEWRQNTTAQKLVFEYQVGAASLTTGTWIAVTALDFTAPKTGTAGALDGNASGNYTDISSTISVSVSDAQEIWFRWTKTASSSPGLAVDDFSVTATGGTSAPLITTPTVTSITDVTAILGGNITSDGGSAITERGTVWNTTTGVVIGNNKIAEGGTTTGVFTHSRSSLPAGTQIFFKAYATNIVGTTLSIESSFYTLSTEPVAHAESFTNSIISQTQIDLSFSAASSITNAAGYLIIQKTGSAPTGTPTDGGAYSVGNAIGDGTVAAVITNSASTSTSITGLTAGTNYYFALIPYSYNGVNNETYNYYIAATIPGTNGTTSAALDATSEVSGPVLGSQPNPTLISSLVTTSGAAIRVFDMDIYDYASTDEAATKITQVTIKTGANNTANWLTVIQGVKLSTNGGTSFVTIGTPTIGASSIIIPITSGNLDVPNNSAVTLSLYVYLNSSGITDNQILEFKVDATAASHGFTADATASTFITTFASAPVSNQIIIDVVATKLNYVQQPSNTLVNSIMSPALTIEAADANNNRDLDKTGSVTLVSSGTMTGPVAVSLTSGFGTFGDVVHTAIGTGLTVTASLSALSDAESSTFDIANGTLLLEENFDYTAGTDLTANGWIAHSGTGTNPITVNNGGLTFTNYSSVSGNAALSDNTGEDINRTFATVSSGSVYTSFLINVTTIASDYFFNLGPSPIGSSYRGRVFIRDVSGNLQFGLSMGAASGTYSSNNYTIGTTYLLVLKYEIVAGANNDQVSLYVFSSLDNYSGEPGTPTVGPISDGTSDINPGSVALRQYSATQNILIDGIRVSNVWSEAPLPVELTSFSALVQNKAVNLTWHTATELNNYGFEVERVRDLGDKVSMVSVWAKVGFVNGAGNSNSPKEYSFTDKSAASGKYLYRLKQLDNDGQYTYSKEVEVDLGTPIAFALEQNYPNPFNPTTSIQYSVVSSQNVTIKVFNVLGKEVAVLVNEKQEPGTYTVEFSTANLASGTYIYRMQAGEFVQTRKMIVLK